MQGRKYFIDNLRWVWILLLIPYHTAMAWNTWGEGNYIWISGNKVLSSFVTFVSPWFMPLLFVLAGISARYALNKRTYCQFLLERVRKIFIPLVIGIIGIVPIMTYFADKFHNNYSGSFFEHYTVFFTRMTDLTGYDGCFTPGHLWFLLYLFVIAVISLAMIALQKKLWPRLTFENSPFIILCLLILLPIIAKNILNFGGKSIGEYMIFYLLGYYIFSEENILNKLNSYKYICLGIMLVSDILTTYLFIWEKQTNWLVSIGSELSSWFGILAFLGIGQRFLSFNNKFTSYMSKNSFLIYIFHFPWVIAIQYYLSQTSINTFSFAFLTIVGAGIGTFVVCELIRRIPVTRVLFGCKK